MTLALPDEPTVAELPAFFGEIPPESIVSRKICANGQLKAVLFGFAAGEGLSEHTAAQPAVLLVLAGTGSITLGEKQHEAKEGFFAYMPANLPHSVVAHSEMRLLLLLLKREA